MAIVSIRNPDGTPFNFDEIAAWDGIGGSGPIPGTFLFEISAAVQEMSKNSKPQLVLDLTVIQGAETETENGKTTKHWLSLANNKGSAGRLKSLLDAVGITALPFDDQDLPGRQFWAEVYEDTYEVQTPLGPVSKTSSKIRCEQAAEGAATAAPAAAAPAPAPAPARAPALAAAPARATAPQLPAGARVATSVPAPGARVPLPPRKTK